MKKKTKQTLWVVFIAMMLVAGAGYYAFSKGWILQSVAAATAEPEKEEAFNTSIVRRGDLIITADGSGEVIPSAEYDLGFSTSSSKLAELYVQIGDIVAEGDTLAVADNLAELEAIVKAAEIDLLLAKEELANLIDNSALAIAEAEAALATAKSEAEDAWVTDYYAGSGVRCSQAQIDLYQLYYEDAADNLLDAQDDNDGTERALEKLISAQSTARTALANLNYCLGQTDEVEVEQASADLTIADITVQKLQAALDYLQENGGVDLEEQLQLELNVANAELALQQAHDDLNAAQLTAPIDGVVTDVSAYVGQSVGSSSFITIADLTTTTISVYIDEVDMDKIGVGYEVEVTFDAIEDRVFYGTVTTVYPSMHNSGNTNLVYGEAVIMDDTIGGTEYMLEGMSAAVEVIGGRAEDAILVPIEALRDSGDGVYSVFVVVDGDPILKFVEVGLMDYYYAEIISGLEEGDVVTTGIVEVE
jgi:multidrug efflux pump subunit AcrA (membrane-fusion protein)